MTKFPRELIVPTTIATLAVVATSAAHLYRRIVRAYRNYRNHRMANGISRAFLNTYGTIDDVFDIEGASSSSTPTLVSDADARENQMELVPFNEKIETKKLARRYREGAVASCVCHIRTLMYAPGVENTLANRMVVHRHAVAFLKNAKVRDRDLTNCSEQVVALFFMRNKNDILNAAISDCDVMRRQQEEYEDASRGGWLSWLTAGPAPPSN